MAFLFNYIVIIQTPHAPHISHLRHRWNVLTSSHIKTIENVNVCKKTFVFLNSLFWHISYEYLNTLLTYNASNLLVDSVLLSKGDFMRFHKRRNTCFYPQWYSTYFDNPRFLVFHTVISIAATYGTGSTWPILKSLRTILYYIVSHIFTVTRFKRECMDYGLIIAIWYDKNWHETGLRTNYVLVTCCAKYVTDKEKSLSWTCSNK